MSSALEKHKLVYILNRDAAARLTISSPLEAHKVRFANVNIAFFSAFNPAICSSPYTTVKIVALPRGWRRCWIRESSLRVP
jgi:hypothetical protein